MKKKSKLKTIFEAFTEEVPVDEQWFKDRMDKCEECEYNSDNIPPDELSLSQKLQVKTLCGSKPMCTACGCCLAEKLGRKTEYCGLKDLGKNPKWVALKAETSNNKNIDVEILDKTAEEVRINDKEGIFEVYLGKVTETLKQIDLLITRKAGLRISEIKATCQCTVPVVEQIDENTIKVKVKINTTNFQDNYRFVKSINVIYFVNRQGTDTTKIKFIGDNKK